MRLFDRWQRPRQRRSGLMGTDRLLSIRHAFVDAVPDADLMEDDVLYVSMPYATAIHKCACGCGQQAVTPLSPEEWSLTYNGEAISLKPSIGNWGMTCKSHYWIRNSRVIWILDQQRNVLWPLRRWVRKFLRRPASASRDRRRLIPLAQALQSRRLRR